MKKTQWIVAALGIVAGTALAPMGYAAAEEDDAEEEVAFAEAPQAVQDRFKQLIANPPAKLDKELEDGVVVYEAEFKVDGVKQAVTVTESGELKEIEKKLPTSQLPAAIVSAVNRVHPGATIKSAESVHEKGQAAPNYYELKVKIGKKSEEIKVSPTGEILPK